MDVCDHCEEIVEELRLLALETDESRGPGSVSMRILEIIDKLEAASSPEPKPETAEAETARLSLKFCKWARLPVRCTYNPIHSTLSHPLDNACINPRPAAPLTADAVLEVLEKERLPHWRVGTTGNPEKPFVAYRVGGMGKTSRAARKADLALLRALDAAGVMKEAAR